MAQADRERRGEIVEKSRKKTDKPPLYQVVLHNDDYTTMEFVVSVLEGIFAKSPTQAHQIMMQVHTRGAGIAGIYPHEVAETKVTQVHSQARERGFPLRASLQKE
jgi:ATP-dependent Clp protease adaptor protein ClpS